MERPICSLDGCNNLSMKHHKRIDGTYSYRKLCAQHHKRKYHMRRFSKDNHPGIEFDGLTEKPCEECGWDKSYCDIHRIVNGKDGGKYEISNVKVLCPNCHRIKHQMKK